MGDQRFDYPKVRLKINRDMTKRAICVLVSEGNKATYDLLLTCMSVDPNIVLTLDTMNCRGAQVWCAFSGYCGGFFPKFKECVMNRDQQLIDFVNQHVPQFKATRDQRQRKIV